MGLSSKRCYVRLNTIIEIETKIKLSTEVKREQLLEKLAPKLSALLTEKHQIDTVFLLPEQVDAPIVPGSKIMRVRDVLDPKSGELIKSLMTLKIERETKLVSDEHKFHSSQDEGAFAGVGVKGRDVDGAV